MQMSWVAKIFTLIELLIVITIIAVLASMMLPVLEKSRGKVKQISCAHNMKQLGVSMLCYVNDWNGYIPLSYTAYDACYGNWIYNLAAYLDPERRHRMTGSSVFRCPGQNYSEFTDLWGWYESYAANTLGFAYVETSDRKNYKLDQIQKPSLFVAIIETKNRIVFSPGATDPWYNGVFPDEWTRGFRHSGMFMNTLHADGHVGIKKAPMSPLKNDPYSWGKAGEWNN